MSDCVKQTQSGYVYKMFDNPHGDGSPIYIGRTDAPKRRFRQHFRNLHNGKMTQEQYWSVQRIEYADCGSHDDSAIAERYLISNLKPKYNTCMTDGCSRFAKNEVESLKWEVITAEELASLKQTSASRQKRKKSQNGIIKGCVLALSTGCSYELYYTNKTFIDVLCKDEYNDKYPISPDYRDIYYYDGYEEDFYKILQEAEIPVFRDVLYHKELCSLDEFDELDLCIPDIEPYEEIEGLDLYRLINEPEYDVLYTYKDYRKQVRDVLKQRKVKIKKRITTGEIWDKYVCDDAMEE